jgi:hypothetical protein
MHECCICKRTIYCGDEYFDGGYGKRAHTRCNPESRRAVFHNCNVCGRSLRFDQEFAIGMCYDCAEE